MNASGQGAIRRGTPDDASKLIEMLSLALAADPFVDWLTGGDPRRRRRYVEVVLHHLTLPWGEVFVTEEVESAALWVPPGRWELGFWQQLRLMPAVMRTLGFGRVGSLSRELGRIEEARPMGPWFLLALLGTHPKHRRKGLAGAVLEPVLRRCDTDGHLAVLDTASPSNVSFYQRFGFESQARLTLGAGGPRCWVLSRPHRRPNVKP